MHLDAVFRTIVTCRDPRAQRPRRDGCGIRLKLECLVSTRHFYASAAKPGCELPHGCLLAVGKKRAGGGRCIKPGKQLGLIRMSRKAVDRVNAGADGNVLAQHAYRVAAVDNLASERAEGSESNKNDRT